MDSWGGSLKLKLPIKVAFFLLWRKVNQHRHFLNFISNHSSSGKTQQEMVSLSESFIQLLNSWLEITAHVSLFSTSQTFSDNW